MITINKIVSMCPAAPGWRAHYDDNRWRPVAMWVLVKTDSGQMIVPMAAEQKPLETMAMLEWEIQHCTHTSFVPIQNNGAPWND